MVRKIKTFRYKSEFKGFLFYANDFNGLLAVLSFSMLTPPIAPSPPAHPTILNFLKKYFFESYEFNNTYSQVSPGPQFQSPQHQRQTAPHQVMPSGQVGTDSMHCIENRTRNTQTNFMLLGQFTIDYLNE